MLSNEQNVLIKEIAQDKGFRNFSVSVEEGSRKGDNYLGNIFLITIKEKDDTKEESLILKCALESEQVRAQMPINSCYKREVFLYDTVIPAFKELQKKHPLPHEFKAFAKIYGFSLEEGKEWLLLENITTRGFKMFNRKIPMDAEHVTTVLKEHAKLHSLSFVMKYFEPDQYRKLVTNLNDYFKEYPQIAVSWAEGIKKKLDNVYKTMESDEKVTKGLKKCEQDFEISFKEMDGEDCKLVIIHGDSWCNNMMFKYEDTNNPTKPTELCFLDWQISKVATPIADLCYFMFLSASKEVLDNHKTYLRQYYQVLDENLRAVQLQVNSVFPYSLLEDHWKKFCTIGLYTVMAMSEILSKDEKDAQTFSEMAEGNKDIFKAFIDQGHQNEQSYNKIKNIVSMLVDNKYL